MLQNQGLFEAVLALDLKTGEGGRDFVWFKEGGGGSW